jgi:histidine triad (HIT) family protein
MTDLSPEAQKKQELYRDARFTKQYDGIWQSVGKCVFCDLREKYVFFEENGIVMTISLFAYIDGHFMIMPRRHIRSPKELTQTEWDTIRKFSYIAKKMIKEVHGISGMQLVQKDGANAQSTVDQHLHFHCIPFDAPDLCVWNFRKLKYTPLENVALYKKDRKKILEHSLKYDKKYRKPQALPIMCNAIIMNDRREVLFEERAKDVQLSRENFLSLPGGRVDDVTKTLESELAREVREETNIDISGVQLVLIASQIDGITTIRTSKALNAKYPVPASFLWNIYKVERADLSAMKPGDDCAGFVWIPLKDIPMHPRLSEGTRGIFRDKIL